MFEQSATILNGFLSQFPQEFQPQIAYLFQAAFQMRGKEQVESFLQSFRILFGKLNSSKKIKILEQKIHRTLVLKIIFMGGINHYSYSYFNNAKLTQKHLQYLEEVGPYLFIEAVMISSKLHIINKTYSRIFSQDHLYNQQQDPINSKIRELMKLCDQKKRKNNNNLKKLQLLLGDSNLRVQLIKQLGKMLRSSWKQQKNKKIKKLLIKKQEVIETSNKANIFDELKSLSDQSQIKIIKYSQLNIDFDFQHPQDLSFI